MQSLLNLGTYNYSSNNKNCSFKSAIKEDTPKSNADSKQTNPYIKKLQAQIANKDAEKEFKNKDYRKAIYLYNISITKKSDAPETYYYLAKAYKDAGDVKNAMKTYNKLLTAFPKEKEGITLMGDCYKETKQYNTAQNYYEYCLQLDPKYDLASRGLKELNYLKLLETNPTEAEKLKNKISTETLKEALNCVKKGAPSNLVEALHPITFAFDSTDELSGHQNIAQYQNQDLKIVVSDKYRWAAPQVIAAYIVHEAVHSKDRDPYTSIKEEQDAYRAAAKFWINNNDGIKDPEMDFAKELYTKSPKALDAKVREIYASRDGSMKETSPNHQLLAKILRKNKPQPQFNRTSLLYEDFLDKNAKSSPDDDKRKLTFIS